MLTLLITLDCVRADHFGPGSDRTPNLNAEAHRWTLFEQAFAHSQNTLSSHLSMLSSNWLFQHGVYNNFANKPLPAHALPGRLMERGWECRAFTGADFLARLLGNQLGEPDPRFPADDDHSLKARLARRLHGGRVPAGKTLSLGLNWLASTERKRDVFLWLHLFDAHMVYSAPRRILRRHVARGEAPRSVAAALRERGWFFTAFPEYQRRVPLDHFPQRYAPAVAYLDEALASFFSQLRTRGWWDEAMVVMTADHGECLMGDHGVYCAHKKLFDTTIHVPLWLKFPRGRLAGERVNALVAHVDLAPTVARAAGFSEPLYMGQDLVGVAEGMVQPTAAVFSEHVDNFQRAVRDENWIYIERVEGVENKWSMPLEQESLFHRNGTPTGPEGPAVEARLREHLNGILAEGREVAGQWSASQAADVEIGRRLESMGYM